MKIDLNRKLSLAMTAMAIAALTACGGGGSGGGGSGGYGGVANSPPSFNAGPDISLTGNGVTARLDVGSPAVLQGYASDPNGDPLTFTWSFVSVPPGSTAPPLRNSNSATPSFTPTAAGVYVLSGSASDGKASSSSGTVRVTVVSERLKIVNPGVKFPGNEAVDCSRIMAASPIPPNLLDKEMIEVDRVLRLSGSVRGQEMFARAPVVFMWWIRSRSTDGMDATVLETATHETSHWANLIGTQSCYGDQFFRFNVDGSVIKPGLLRNFDTMPLNKILPFLPTELRSTSFAQLYLGSETGKGGLFFALEEFSAYAAGADIGYKIASNADISYLGDLNVGNFEGLMNFMLYTQKYLQAARTTAPDTYNTILAQSGTLAFIQLLWTKSEDLLTKAAPYATVNESNTAPSGTVDQQLAKPIFVARSLLRAIYSDASLAELDAIGIKHKKLSDWNGLYF